MLSSSHSLHLLVYPQRRPGVVGLIAVVGVAEGAELAEAVVLLIEAAGLVGTNISISFIAALTSLVRAIINLKQCLMEVSRGGRFSLLSRSN